MSRVEIAQTEQSFRSDNEEEILKLKSCDAEGMGLEVGGHFVKRVLKLVPAKFLMRIGESAVEGVSPEVLGLVESALGCFKMAEGEVKE